MPVLVHCENCGKPFYAKSYKMEELQEGVRHSLCCSRECAYQVRQGRPVLARRRRVTLTCEICGKSFEETVVHAENRRFCSIACKAEYQRTALLGEGNPYYGHRHSEETRQKISQNHVRWHGKDHPNWRGGAKELTIAIRKSRLYKEWRDAVFRRDGYRSVLSGERGRSSELSAHHIKPFIEILREMLALYPELSPQKDVATLCEIAMHYAPFWDVDNGITLLRQEHIELHYAEDSQDDDD